MWRTPDGVRTLCGQEAELVRELLGWVYDQTDDAVRYDDPELAFEAGIALYDNAQPSQQLALLAEVGTALLDPTVPEPKLTAPREATIAALFAALRIGIQIDIDEHVAGDISPFHWRLMLRESYLGDAEDDEVPDAECTDLNEWGYLIEAAMSRLLWDADWDMEDMFVDESPEKSAYLKSLMRIPDGYYEDIPHDPNRHELKTIRGKLNELAGCNHDLDV